MTRICPLISSVAFLVISLISYSYSSLSPSSPSSSYSSSSSLSSSLKGGQDTSSALNNDNQHVFVDNCTEKAKAILRDLTGRFSLIDGKIVPVDDEAGEGEFFKFRSGREYMQVLRAWAALEDNPFSLNDITLAGREASLVTDKDRKKVVKCQFRLVPRQLGIGVPRQPRSKDQGNLVDPLSVTSMLYGFPLDDVTVIDDYSDSFVIYMKDNFFNDPEFALAQKTGTEELPVKELQRHFMEVLPNR